MGLYDRDYMRKERKGSDPEVQHSKLPDFRMLRGFCPVLSLLRVPILLLDNINLLLFPLPFGFGFCYDPCYSLLGFPSFSPPVIN
jgi:hypothetical protein